MTFLLAEGYYRGHKIVTYNGMVWLYADTNEPCDKDRPCIKCGLKAENDDAPDPCIGYLKHAKYACCGHGIKDEDYVLTENNERISLKEYFERYQK